MLVRISIVLDGRRAKKANKYPVKLRVNYQGKVKYYSTAFDLTKEDFGKLTAKRISAEFEKIRDQINDIESEAKSFARQMDRFVLSEFEREFVSQNRLLDYKVPKDQQSIINEFDYSPFYTKFSILKEGIKSTNTVAFEYLKYIQQLLQEGRISTAVSYHASYSSLSKFQLPERFSDITPTYLTRYEQWILSQNLSKATVGIYLRPLKCLFNEANAAGIIRKEKCYPFGRRKYQIPKGRNVKKALSLADVEKIYYYQCDRSNPSEERARDFWLFCYFGNGMNIKDIALLRNKDIHGEMLAFERAKTERAMRSDPKVITVIITEDMKLIMDRWGSKCKDPDSYVFPILTPGETPLRKYELVQLFVSFVNKWMREIVKRLGIDKNVTTYVARHTFSTVLKRSGASMEYIQEALGHADLRTTENHLDSFEMEVKKEFASKLTAFKR
ncbi:phage integrase SAM-like domain-containing protein [Puia sp. P3]|uniref:phage integrase SAM-like domain-containing protein n=1 Tax=Puia sp. P3 TaxID=3423952 RepID=UPI003D675887